MSANNATATRESMPSPSQEAPHVRAHRLLVTDESTVAFRVRKMGMYDVKGRFGDIEGYVEVAGDGTPLGGAAVVDAASVNTRMPPRDRHLRGRDFLDVAEHPTIEAVVDQVRLHEDGWFAVAASFALHGVERRVDLRGHLHGAPSGEDAVILHLSATIDRRDFGIRARRPFEWVVAREVRLDAELVLRAAG